MHNTGEGLRNPVAEDAARLLRHHREVALEAMEFLHDYHPYLTGAALEGTSSAHSAVTIHLAADWAEEVMFFLEDQKIPFQTHDRRARIGGKKEEIFPLLRFYVDEVEVELVIFPYDDRLNSPITGKAVRRADRKKVKALLDGQAQVGF